MGRKESGYIRADGEYRSAIKLAQAAHELGNDDIAVELRRLQTLERISKEKNQTTLLVPMKVFNNSDGVEKVDLGIDLNALEAELAAKDKADYAKGYDSLGDPSAAQTADSDESPDK